MFYSDMGELGEHLAALDLPANVNSEELVAMYCGCQYVVNLLEDQGLDWRGYSYRNRVPLGLLVVKATVDSTPVVAFISARSLTDAFRIFFRQLADRLVQWIPDKYG